MSQAAAHRAEGFPILLCTLWGASQIFLSALIDVARHAGKAEEAEAVVEEMEMELGVPFGTGATSSLMGLYAQVRNPHLAAVS